jgi:hypothetical protein
MTAAKRIARGIEYVERCHQDNDACAGTARPHAAVHWRTLPGDCESALAILRAAAPLPDALERICAIARRQIAAGSLERRYLWHKIASAMDLHYPPPRRTGTDR